MVVKPFFYTADLLICRIYHFICIINQFKTTTYNLIAAMRYTAIILLTFVFSCQKPDVLTSVLPGMVKLHTMEEVRQIAKEYNMEDLATEENNGSLMYFTKEQLHAYFAKAKKDRAGNQEFLSYQQRTRYVRSYQDYLNLLDSLPNMKASMIEADGGEEQFRLESAEMLKTQWHIFRSEEDGSLAWIHPTTDPSKISPVNGKRIDNLPK
jgi:hypothetical protein